MSQYDWSGVQTLNSKKYICGYCGQSLSSEKGYFGNIQPHGLKLYIYVCHSCGKPTFFDSTGKQTPGAIFGKEVGGVSDKTVANLYKEARQCMSVNSFTSTVLSCRKLLMHIAVDKGAKEGLRFIEYVEYLASKNIIPNGAQDWVDIIREKGNEANHEITIMNENDAKSLINFTEMLLKIVYEFPAEVEKIKNLQKADEDVA